MGNDVHVTGCDFVLKVLAAGQMQIVFAMSTSARDRQECWGRSRDSCYSLHITLAKRKENDGPVLLLHCKEQVNSVIQATMTNFLALKGHLSTPWLYIIVKKVCIFWELQWRSSRSFVWKPGIDTRMVEMTNLFGLSANSCLIASLRLADKEVYIQRAPAISKKRWYQICHCSFLPCCHKRVRKSMHFNILILAIKLIKEVCYTIPICCWFRRT